MHKGHKTPSFVWFLTCHGILGNSFKHMEISKEKSYLHNGAAGSWEEQPPGSSQPSSELPPLSWASQWRRAIGKGVYFSFSHWGNLKLETYRPTFWGTGIDQPSHCPVDKWTVWSVGWRDKGQDCYSEIRPGNGLSASSLIIGPLGEQRKSRHA